MLAVVAAMRRELSAIERGLNSRRKPSNQPTYLVTGNIKDSSLVLATTGIGGGRGEDMVSYLSDRYGIRGLISLGYAGAAAEGLGPGTLALYSRVALLEESPFAADSPLASSLSPDPQMIAGARVALERSGLDFREGIGVTAPSLIGSPDAKRRIGEATGALALDMESYWIARAAEKRGLPFLAVRAITDSVERPVPDLSHLLDSAGNVKVFSLIAHLARHPGNMLPMMRLSKASRLANERLARFVEAFVAAGSAVLN